MVTSAGQIVILSDNKYLIQLVIKLECRRVAGSDNIVNS